MMKPDALARGESLTGMPAEDWLRHTVFAFNAWVNVGDEPIEELPLAVCDTSTLNPEDIRQHALQHGLKSQGVQWSRDQRWCYRRVGFGEGYRFRTTPEKTAG